MFWLAFESLSSSLPVMETLGKPDTDMPYVTSRIAQVGSPLQLHLLESRNAEFGIPQ